MITSEIISGCMNWGKWGVGMNSQQYHAHIKSCIEIGITTFDHADIYGHYTTEAEFGNALKLESSLRDKIQLISKCGICLVTPNRLSYRIKHYDTSRSHIITSVEKSLENLRSEYLDLLLIHRPDPLMDPYEMAETFTILQKSGKVLNFGVSNFSMHQMMLLKSVFPISVNQIELNILHTHPFFDGLVDTCIREDIQVQAWSPLTGGKLYKDDADERCKRILAMSQILAEKYAVEVDQILIAWLLQHPARIKPVLGTTKIKRLKSIQDVVNLKITREEWHMLLRASHGYDVA